MATDPFSDAAPPEPPAAPPPPEPEPAPEPITVAAPEPPPDPPKEKARVPEPPAVEPAAPPPPAPPEKKPKPRGSVEIDLTSALGELEGALAAPVPAPPAPPAEPANLEQVFEGMREESGRQDVADQSAQHMTLGRTYLEMGMADEAINALRTAARSPRQRFEAGMLLGRVYRERGDVPHAIEWLERAAEAPAPSQEAGQALLYDLGAMLEASGETSRALAVFLELQADAGDYRDVAARVDRLARVQTGG
jgi:hypothetical protein